MQYPAPSRKSSFFAWLHSLPDWRFTATLYLLRWAVIVPLALILSPFSTSADAFRAEGNPWLYVIPFLVVAPMLETLIECSLPYWLMYGVMNVERRSPLRFVVVSAVLMVLLHPFTPIVMTMAFITGAFLAYVYYHFAGRSQVVAFLHTAIFHSAINLVGWTALLIQSMA
jgi:hypothetical protein